AAAATPIPRPATPKPATPKPTAAYPLSKILAESTPPEVTAPDMSEPPVLPEAAVLSETPVEVDLPVAPARDDREFASEIPLAVRAAEFAARQQVPPAPP